MLVLQALALQLHGNTALVLAPLRRAVELAAPEGYARIFLDEGAAMTALLHVAATHRHTPGYVSRLLSGGPVGRQADRRTLTDRGLLVEPLSERERAVLRLLATDLGGPDIARELVVSLRTVRTHTRSIYTKLGVTNRRAAVRRASELDLLRTSRH